MFRDEEPKQVTADNAPENKVNASKEESNLTQKDQTNKEEQPEEMNAIKRFFGFGKLSLKNTLLMSINCFSSI